MPKELTILITNACWFNLERNLIERYNKEAIGDLIGKRERNKIILVNSSSWVTAKTNSKEAYSGDDKARKRVMDHDRSLYNSGVTDSSIIGNYHSHPYIGTIDEKRSYIHKGDLEYFRYLMEKFSFEESIQIIATVKHLRFKPKTQLGEFVKTYRKKLNVVSIYSPDRNVDNPKNIYGYDITLAGYLINKKNHKELITRGVSVKIIKRNSW